MRQTRRSAATIFSDFDRVQFATTMSILVFVVLTVFMTIPRSTGGLTPDRPRALHAVRMPQALSEDAIQVTFFRDGKMYFGSHQLNPADLAPKIRERLADHGVERKVYVVADRRTHWGNVRVALDQVRAAGILRVAFLVW